MAQWCLASSLTKPEHTGQKQRTTPARVSLASTRSPWHTRVCVPTHLKKNNRRLSIGSGVQPWEAILGKFFGKSGLMELIMTLPIVKNAYNRLDVHILYNGSVTWTFDCKSFKKLEANESNIYNNANRLLKNCQKLFMIYIAK